jgi:hypothetical protein
LLKSDARGTAGAKCEGVVNLLMNLANAIGFLALGIVMHVLPWFAPSVVSSQAAAQASVRELWLLLMSYVVGGVGISHLAYEAYKQAPIWLSSLNLPAVLKPVFARKPSAPEVSGAAVRVTS